MMKKLIVILLSLMIVFSISISFAADKEITFQGIPWGSNRTEWTESLEKIYGDKIRISKWSETDYLEIKLKNKKLIATPTNQTVPSDIIYISDTIGGYDVNNMFFCSVLVDGYDKYTDTGILLYQVEIDLLVNDVKRAEKDLTDKLSTLYGKASGTIKNFGFFKLSLQYWLGLNDTYVLMGKGAQVDGKDIIVLIYGKMIDPKLFIEQYASSIILTPQPYSDADPSDYKGL